MTGTERYRVQLTSSDAPRQTQEIRVAVIADSHGHARSILGNARDFARRLADTDLLVHAGDLCTGGQQAQLAEELRWISRAARDLPGGAVVVPGNHDHPLETPSLHTKVPGNITVLTGQAHEFGGLKLWGGPWTATSDRWAFHREQKQLAQAWQGVNPDTDLLITHGPPRCALSRHWRWGTEFGDEHLLDAVNRIQPAAHVFGHIHEGRATSGTDQSPGTDRAGQTLLVCASITHQNTAFEPVWLSFTRW